MAKNNINWWLLIGVVVVVAIIASAITAGITGNVISIQKPNSKVNKCVADCQEDCLKLSLKDRTLCRSKCKDSCPKYDDIYTKGEVDAIANKILGEMRDSGYLTSFDTLYLLNKCEVVKDKQESGVISCDDVCKKNPDKKTICIFGNYDGVIRPCNDNSGSINTDRFCNCCTP